MTKSGVVCRYEKGGKKRREREEVDTVAALVRAEHVPNGDGH